MDEDSKNAVINSLRAELSDAINKIINLRAAFELEMKAKDKQIASFKEVKPKSNGADNNERAPVVAADAQMGA
jgi:hypothetical protein